MKKGSRETTFFAIIHLIQYTQKTQTLSAPERSKHFFHPTHSFVSLSDTVIYFIPNAMPINRLS
jgi:hypothetical protein